MKRAARAKPGRTAPPEEPPLDREAAEIYDRTVKIALDADPASILLLAGYKTDLPVRVTNVAISRAEHRADTVLLIGLDTDPDRWAAYIEAQTTPRPSAIPRWEFKHAGITIRTKRPTVLLVLYLKQGDYRTFPDGYEVIRGELTTSFRFSTIRLWEHAEAIWSGRLPGLAALLLLCYKNPKPEVLEREREIILNSDLPEDRKVELLAAAVALGGESFSKEVLRQVFDKVGDMIKEKGLLKEWLDESKAEGKAEASREAIMAVLAAKFGEVPASLAERVQTADVEWCKINLPRAATAMRVEELGW